MIHSEYVDECLYLFVYVTVQLTQINITLFSIVSGRFHITKQFKIYLAIIYKNYSFSSIRKISFSLGFEFTTPIYLRCHCIVTNHEWFK